MTKPERFCISRLDKGITPGKIWQELQKRFGTHKIPQEYQIAFKKMIYLKRERERDISQERFESRNWRDNYLANKSKRYK